MVLQPVRFRVCQLVGIQHRKICRPQRLAKRHETFLLLAHQCVGRDCNRGKLLRWRRSFRARRFNALVHLAAQTRDPHHGEFVQIVAGNRQEPKPLQQRVRRVHCLFQNPRIERQPRQFAVQIAIGPQNERGRIGRYRTGCSCHRALIAA